jgi:hypothetical protein
MVESNLNFKLKINYLAGGVVYTARPGEPLERRVVLSAWHGSVTPNFS